MAGIHRKNRMAPEIIQIFVIVNILSILSTSLATVESHGQAFIQTDNELRYMGEHIDGVPLHISDNNIRDIGLQDGGTGSGPIRFDPPSLDFREQPVGMPHMEQVTVHNPDSKTSLHLLSISGSTLHFHCSFFQDKMVPPGGNTTFDVVFLARQVGTVENTLYIHTTHGSFKYQVVGIGVPNPYRIRPFIGAKVPLNSSFSPLIRMHNPHSSILQVVEMYSSGGDLHLELPTGEKEAPKNLWEIPPFETKPVMRASFVGRIENNHTAFIRIKTNRDKKDEVLILPVEVEVTSSPGIFSPLEMLDFGILRTLDEPKTLRLNLLNSGFKPIHISSITVSPPNDAISIEFRPVKLQPDIIQTTPVALISYIASKAVHHSQWSGKVVVKSKNGQYKVSIPYQSNVLHGSLVYDRNKTMFYTGQPPYKNVTRRLQITNTFNFTLVVYNVSVSSYGRRYFSVENVTSPLMLRPQETVAAFELRFHPNSTHLHLSTEVFLATNASTFVFPVVVYNGKLKVVHHRPEILKGQLDFGTMGVEERRSMTFTLRNDNPVDIIIREYSSNMQKTTVELLGVEKGNGTTLTRSHNISEIDTNPLVIKPYHFAVFSVNLIAPSWENNFTADIVIVTQFENLQIPLTLRTAEGSLNAVPDKIIFENCFPSKAPFRDLMIHSSFDNYMEVRHVTFQPNDTRFYYEPPTPGKATLLVPHKDNMIGRIYFNAKKDCREDCYVGLPTYIPAGHQWLLGATLDKDVADTDQYLYTRFQQRWQLLGQHQLSTINVTIQLDTNQVQGFLFPAQAHLHWPSLVKKQKIKFPLTQIGNLSMSDFIVENPADVPVLIQILPLSLYPNPQTIVDMVSPKLAADLTDYIEMDDLDVFTLQDLELYNNAPTNSLPVHRKTVENVLGVKPHRSTVTLMVAGGTKVRVHVGFSPKDDLSRTSLIIIRNNLTIVDTVVVQGQGGRGEMRFSNKKAGSSMPLLFDMAEKHLKSCDKKKQSKNTPPSFTVKRTFTACNKGQLPFFVHGFSISDSPCEGYGFKVLDCHGFELPPNATRKVDIAFTPDFTMSRMRRMLSVHTSLGPAINYTLQASIPPHMLTRCAAALPRPPWEPVLYYSALCVMGFLLVGILIAAYFEADRIFTADILKRRSRPLSASVSSCSLSSSSSSSLPSSSTLFATSSSSQNMFDKGRVFDLKSIGARAATGPGSSDFKNILSSTTSSQQKAPASQQQEVSTSSVKEAQLTHQHPHHQQLPQQQQQQQQHQQPRRKSVLSRPFAFLRSLFARRSTEESSSSSSSSLPTNARRQTSAPPTTERQNSRDKEVRNGGPASGAHKVAAHDKGAAQGGGEAGGGGEGGHKSAFNSKPLTNTNNKRSRAAKRQPTTTTTTTTTTTPTTTNIDLISQTDLPGINVNDSTNNNSSSSSSNNNNSSSSKKQGNNSHNHHSNNHQTLSGANGSGVHRKVSDADHKAHNHDNTDNGRSATEPKGSASAIAAASPVTSMGAASRKTSGDRGAGTPAAASAVMSAINQLDIIDISDINATTVADEDDIKKEDNKKPRQRKMRKAEGRGSARARSERQLRHEQLTAITTDNDKDDASSTTTESSSAEADDKTSSARESTPEPPASKKRSRGRKEKKRIEPEDEENNDDEFVITSKSKAHKNIKVDPKNSFGGNIMHPHTIELPYTLKPSKHDLPYTPKLESAKGDRSESTPNPSVSSTSDRSSKKSLKNRNKNRPSVVVLPADDSGLALVRSDTDSSDHGSTESPPPSWDMPEPFSDDPPEGDLSDLAAQTAIFAAKHAVSGSGKPLLGQVPTSSSTPSSSSMAAASHGSSPDGLSASSRSSSYSSVVSNGSGADSGRAAKNKYSGPGLSIVETTPSPPPPPVAHTSTVTTSAGMHNPTSAAAAAAAAAKRNLVGFNPEDIKHPGAIGTRTMSPKPTSMPLAPNPGVPGGGMHKNLWPSMAGSPTTPEALQGYSLHPIQETHHSMAPTQQEEAYLNSMKTAGFDDSLGQFQMGSYDQPVTMMQRLRLERRKRLLEYQQRLVHGGEDWPGFGMPAQPSFWDSGMPGPADGWVGVSHSPKRHQLSPPTSVGLQQVVPPLWDNPMNSSPGPSWTSDVSSIWSTNANGSPAETMLSSEPGPGPQPPTPPAPPGSAADRSPPPVSTTPVGSFDPFNTLGNTLGSIWRPNSSGGSSVSSGGTNTWGFPTNTDDVD